jgi:hypothetical protein
MPPALLSPVSHSLPQPHPLLPQSDPPIAPHSTVHHDTGRLPKLSFPRFDGDNPRHWRSLCKDYFEMYSVPSSLWIRVAKQHLDGAAARWFQSIEPELNFYDWEHFCRLLHDRFDRDQKELLIRQLFHIKQINHICRRVCQALH